MYKFVVAMFLIVFDPQLKLGGGNAIVDVLPDFVGYVIMMYGFFSLWKNNKEKKGISETTKMAMVSTALAFVVSYVTYILDMFGKSSDINKYFIVILGFLGEITLLAVIFFYIEMLKVLQEDKIYFQVKAFSTLWKVNVLCILLEYMTMLYVSSVAYTFFVFAVIISIVFIIYMFTTAVTYKMKFLNNQL